jgi:hypothetical protein
MMMKPYAEYRGVFEVERMNGSIDEVGRAAPPYALEGR